MTTLRLKYVHLFTDRHGKRRHYFRRKGFRQIPLPGLPGSEEFMEAYKAALKGETLPKRAVGAERTKPGTMAALIVERLTDPKFGKNSAGVRDRERKFLDRLREEHGDKPVALLRPRHIYEMMKSKAETPTMANRMLTYFRALMKIAIRLEYRDDDPTTHIERFEYESEGHRPWAEEQIQQFEAFWQVGTKQRAALDLLLYTSQRGSDVVVMGKQHVQNQVLSLKQRKTGNWVFIPIHSQLQASLAAYDSGNLTFLVTDYGKPFSVKGFQQWFVQKAIAPAGLPITKGDEKGLSAHGLRKAAARRLAEMGCSDRQIMSITGHKTTSEVSRYTADADQAVMAQEAMRVMERFGRKP